MTQGRVKNQPSSMVHSVCWNILWLLISFTKSDLEVWPTESLVPFCIERMQRDLHSLVLSGTKIHNRNFLLSL
uniref:Uncharacterized protein n=1 Tax=Anguilla anguilla TaxID=7936 RepID=A0A0E9W6J7_ANGAN